MKLLVMSDEGEILDTIEDQGVGEICAAYGFSPHTESHLLPDCVLAALAKETADKLDEGLRS